jgi:chemotaxis protein CheD
VSAVAPLGQAPRVEASRDRAIKTSWDAHVEAEVARILPGEFYATDGPAVISTVLGSCVSACIHDPVAQVGGMNHFMLPSASASDRPQDAAARYGLAAMEQLINALLKLGGRRERLQVKLTGGGRMFANRMDIGVLNSTFALDFVSREGLHLINQDLGGMNPRRVLYYPASGRLRVQKMPAIEARTLEIQEQALAQRIASEEAGSVELF